MQLYCRDGVVLATHEDHQTVPASAYGEGVSVLPVPDGTVLERFGEAPAEGEIDVRPFAMPALTPAVLATYAASRRFAVETGGCKFNGITLATDRESAGIMLGAVVWSQIHPAATRRWKAASGWVTLGAAEITALGNAVAAHIQSSFDVEAAVSEGIDNGEITTIVQIDAAAWPSNG